MATRDIYLEIERIADYSPVEPDGHVSPPLHDCMRNPGHEDGTISGGEGAARWLTALFNRECPDLQSLVPKPSWTRNRLLPRVAAEN